MDYSLVSVMERKSESRSSYRTMQDLINPGHGKTSRRSLYGRLPHQHKESPRFSRRFQDREVVVKRAVTSLLKP